MPALSFTKNNMTMSLLLRISQCFGGCNLFKIQVAKKWNTITVVSISREEESSVSVETVEGRLTAGGWRGIIRPSKRAPLTSQVWWARENHFWKHVLAAGTVYTVPAGMQVTHLGFLWNQFIQHIFIEHFICAWQRHIAGGLWFAQN